MTQRALIAWSGGKDSALALHEVQRAGEPDVAALLTTVTEEYDRISMHGIRRELLERQAESIRLPLLIVWIPGGCSDEEYGTRMRAMLEDQKAHGVSSVIFGDVFLEDVRLYREGNLGQVDMRAVFPLWRRDTAELARQFIERDFRAVTTCVDSEHLDREFVGREFDAAFLADLPDGTDPCGENGEFHTFVYDGPIFRQPIAHTLGDIVLRDERFWYCDALPSRPGSQRGDAQ
ncbi:MAG: diphthine--ammonia ligase [Armatimonadota bacterium]|jgi:uncharacterized protein (TIGR00290 family)